MEEWDQSSKITLKANFLTWSVEKNRWHMDLLQLLVSTSKKASLQIPPSPMTSACLWHARLFKLKMVTVAL